MRTFIFGLIFGIILLACEGNFEQVGYYKSEKNVYGGYNRVFSVYVKSFQDTPDMWRKIEKYAKNKMYTSGGNTTVFFFDSRVGTPDVTYTAEQFDNKYEKNCIAAYWKYSTGIERFKRYPFKE